MNNVLKSFQTGLFMKCMILVLAAASTVAFAKESSKEKAKETDKSSFKEITWQKLMPPVDENMVKKWDAGELSQKDANAYVTELGNTPVKAMDKSPIKIPGFLVPLNIDKNQMATELLLVPTAGSCVHTPPPPPNQTIFVRYPKGIKVTEAGYIPYWIEGTLQVEKNTSVYTDTLYGIDVANIKEYE